MLSRWLTTKHLYIATGCPGELLYRVVGLSTRTKTIPAESQYMTAIVPVVVKPVTEADLWPDGTFFNYPPNKRYKCGQKQSGSWLIKRQGSSDKSESDIKTCQTMSQVLSKQALSQISSCWGKVHILCQGSQDEYKSSFKSVQTSPSRLNGQSKQVQAKSHNLSKKVSSFVKASLNSNLKVTEGKSKAQVFTSKLQVNIESF